MTENKKFSWGSIFNSALLIAILGIVIQQYFFKSNKQTEGRIELRKDFLKENYALYNKVIFWTNMNTQWEPLIVFQDSLMAWKNSIVFDSADVADSSGQIAITIEGAIALLVMADTSMQKVWREYTNEINNEKFKIEPDILHDYNRIIALRDQMELTNDSTLTHLKELGWVQGPAYTKWINMNKALRQKIKSYTNLE